MKKLCITQDALSKFYPNPHDLRSKREQFLYPFYMEPSYYYDGEWQVRCNIPSARRAYGDFIGARTQERAVQLVTKLNTLHIKDNMAAGTVYLSEEKGKYCV